MSFCFLFLCNVTLTGKKDLSRCTRTTITEFEKVTEKFFEPVVKKRLNEFEAKEKFEGEMKVHIKHTEMHDQIIYENLIRKQLSPSSRPLPPPHSFSSTPSPVSLFQLSRSYSLIVAENMLTQEYGTVKIPRTCENILLFLVYFPCFHYYCFFLSLMVVF